MSLFRIVKVRDEGRDSGISIHRSKGSKQEQRDRVVAETSFFGVSISQKVSKKREVKKFGSQTDWIFQQLWREELVLRGRKVLVVGEPPGGVFWKGKIRR